MAVVLTEAELAELAEVGPFFAVEAHRPDSAPRPPWQPIGELIEAFAERVTEVRARLAANNGLATTDVEQRVAASVAQLGVVARLVSPIVAVAMLRGELLTLTGARWQLSGGSVFPMSVAVETSRPRNLAEAFARQLSTGPVGELVSAAAAFSVPARIGWGNVASAVNGAASMISAARPARGSAQFVARLLDLPPLADTGITQRDGRFQRRSCCLIYRAAPNRAGPICGDCVLNRR
jgi:hypothetical protein